MLHRNLGSAKHNPGNILGMQASFHAFKCFLGAQGHAAGHPLAIESCPCQIQIPSIRGIQGAKECLAIKEQHWECLIIIYHFDCLVVFDDGILLDSGILGMYYSFFHTSCNVWCVWEFLLPYHSTCSKDLNGVRDRLTDYWDHLVYLNTKISPKTKQKGLHPKRLQAHTNRSSDNPLFFSCYAGAICFSSPEFTWETKNR